MLHIGYISAVDQLSVFVNQIKLNFVFLDIEKQTTDQLLIYITNMYNVESTVVEPSLIIFDKVTELVF